MLVVLVHFVTISFLFFLSSSSFGHLHLQSELLLWETDIPNGLSVYFLGIYPLAPAVGLVILVKVFCFIYLVFEK